MKVEFKVKPVTLMMRAKNPAEIKRIEDVQEALTRQVGFPVILDKIWYDSNNDEWRSVSWPMRRADQAAVNMLLRRGKKPNDPALLTGDDIHEKKLTAQVVAEKNLRKNK